MLPHEKASGWATNQSKTNRLDKEAFSYERHPWNNNQTKALLEGWHNLAGNPISISASYAAQVIYIDILDFTPDRSDYILDDAQREVELQRLTVPLAIGNAWRIIEDSDALGAKAMDCPGDSDTDTTFSELTFEFQINAGETGPWAVWARLNRRIDPNSFLYRTSPDGENWNPPEFSGSGGWNNPPRRTGAVPGQLVETGTAWYWYKAAPDAADPVEGQNFLNISPRESARLPAPTIAIDMPSFRNDGNDLTDAEATPFISEGKFLQPGIAVDVRGKLTTTWARIKSQR